jgi:hypothetical protein
MFDLILRQPGPATISATCNPISCAAEVIESMTPAAKFGGVDSTLPSCIVPSDAATTVSVQVPPTSVATM